MGKYSHGFGPAPFPCAALTQKRDAQAMVAIDRHPEPAGQTLTSGRARLGKRPSSRLAVLYGHVDPCSCEQQRNCRPPEHVKDGISAAPARFPHPVHYPGFAAAFPNPTDQGRGRTSVPRQCRAARWRLFLIERDTDPTRLSPDNATMMIAVLCIDNQVE